MNLFTILNLMLLTGMILPQADTMQEKTAFLNGCVMDNNGQPVAFANIQIAGTTNWIATDINGNFTTTSTSAGKITIIATRIGYEKAKEEVVLVYGETTRVSIILQEELISLKEAIITASAYTTGEAQGIKGTTLKTMDVITTSGAAADIFRAIQTLPGTVILDDGAGLFVRGGDVSETIVILDQATIHHPYKYESPTGGMFGTISPFLVSGTFFSTGGFPARYGNALSGVLAMESRGMPEYSTITFGLGLAAISGGTNIVLKPEKLGVRFSGNLSNVTPMYKLNGRGKEFVTTPEGSDGNLSIIQKYSATGQVNFFNHLNASRLGVRVNQPSFYGVYCGDETNRFHNLQWSDVWNSLILRMSLSLNQFDSKNQLGNLDLTTSNAIYKWRLDILKNFGESISLQAGTEIERIKNHDFGTIPFTPDLLDPNAKTYHLNHHITAYRWAGYCETENKIFSRLLLGIGARVDYYNQAKQLVFDPRFSLQYRLIRQSNIRMSWGIYHQFPHPRQYNPVSGKPELKAQKAYHLIAGFDYEQNYFMARVELYHKRYANLVLRDKEFNSINRGDGISSGIDVFIKYGSFLLTPFNGWISYSYLHSRRLQSRDLVTNIVYEQGPSPYDVTHSLTIVGKLRLIGFLSAGMRVYWATGRPITPVLGAVKHETYEYYLPIDGAVGSERLPAFQRVDTDLSYFLPFGKGHSMVCYLAVSNVFNRRNVLGYDYSVDYQERFPRLTNWLRMFYFGISSSFVL